MATFNFYLRDKKAKEKSKIVLFVRYNNKTVKFPTPHSISPKNWNPDKQTAKGVGAPELNNYITSRREKVSKLFIEKSNEGLIPTDEEIAELLRVEEVEHEPQKELTLIDHLNNFIKEKKAEVKPNTLKKYNSLKIHLEEFEKKNKTILAFDDINHHFERRFRKFLIEEKNHLNDTIGKYFSTFKAFMKWAQKEELHSNIKYQDFTVERSSGYNDQIVLSFEELEQLKKLELTSNPLLDKVRDLFLFQCYTGQRIGDVINLKWDEIKLAKKEWHLYQIKGNKPVRVNIPLFDEAIRILKKYPKTNENPVFGRISDVEVNEQLKKIGKLAEFNSIENKTRYSGKERIDIVGTKASMLTSHCARRTFVTISLERGMIPEDIMQITGHSDYRTMKRYINLRIEKIHNNAREAWEKPVMKVS